MSLHKLLVFFPVFALALQAAPKLRLTAATVGPISISQGQNAPTQTLEAFNLGDGSLNLTYSSTAQWVTAVSGAARPCSQRDGSCIPVNFTFSTSGLAEGMQTAVVTVSDPNALDAPQTVTVTVQVGGGVPSNVELYVAPNGGDTTYPFSSNSNLTGSATTQSGGSWLSLALDGTGSFRFVYPYQIRARHLEGMPEGVYAGQLAVSGSSVPAENRTVGVTLHVTSQPIVRLTPNTLSFRVAQGAVDQKAYLSVVNAGLHPAAVSGVTATTASGGDWLAAEHANGLVTVTAKMTNMSPGSYRGTVTVASNAANGSQSVPVTLDVVEPGPPFSVVEGVRDTGAFETTLAPGGVAAIFGEQYSMLEPKSASALPLPTEMDGVRVLVNGVAAPLYWVSYNQINFQIPAETAVGDAVVRVERNGTVGNGVSVPVAARAPRIIRTGVGDSGVIVTGSGGIAMPGGVAAKPGEVITIYCVGFGLTDVDVPSGAGAPLSPLAQVPNPPKVIFGSPFTTTHPATPLFVGLTPSLVGLYIVNVIVPPDVPQGDIFLRLEGDGYASNRVIIPIRE